MPSLIAVANLKGGVGKTTLAVNLACQLASAGAVLLVDADPQATATQWSSQGRLPIRCEGMPLSATKDIGRWVQRITGQSGKYVIIDCPPALGTATEAAMGVADLVLVPVTPSGADLMATASALELVKRARTARGGREPTCLLIPSRVDRRTAAGREIEEALRQFKESIGPVLHQRAALADSFNSGQWIGDYAPGSAGHQDVETLAAAVRKASR